MPREHITELRRAFRDLFRLTLPKSELVELLSERGRHCPPVAELATFVADSTRPIMSGRARQAPDDSAVAPEGAAI